MIPSSEYNFRKIKSAMDGIYIITKLFLGNEIDGDTYHDLFTIIYDYSITNLELSLNVTQYPELENKLSEIKNIKANLNCYVESYLQETPKQELAEIGESELRLKISELKLS